MKSAGLLARTCSRESAHIQRVRYTFDSDVNTVHMSQHDALAFFIYTWYEDVIFPSGARLIHVHMIRANYRFIIMF